MKTTEIKSNQKFWHNGERYTAVSDGAVSGVWVDVVICDEAGDVYVLSLHSAGHVQPA